MGRIGYSLGVRIACLLVCAGCGSAASAGQGTSDPAVTPGDGGACGGAPTLTCQYFDVSRGGWSTAPPTLMSIQNACAQGGSNGEIDAYLATSGQYWLDRVGFAATGSAL